MKNRPQMPYDVSEAQWEYLDKWQARLDEEEFWENKAIDFWYKYDDTIFIDKVLKDNKEIEIKYLVRVLLLEIYRYKKDYESMSELYFKNKK